MAELPKDKLIFSYTNFQAWGIDGVTIGRDSPGLITVFFSYDPFLVATAKTVPGDKWHPIEKYWTFPGSDRTVKKILESFQGAEIHMDPTVQIEISSHVIARGEVPKQSQSATHHSSHITNHDFEGLRRKLVTRK